MKLINSLKSITGVTTLIITSVATCSVSAASLDFRQEYKSDSEDYASRIKISESIGNHFFGVEAKQSGEPFSDWSSGDNEFEYGYVFYNEDAWRLTASMPVTFGSSAVTYKPQIRAQYTFDSGLVAKLRYRHEFRDYESASDTEDGDRSKITANLDYNWDNFQFGFETNYADDWTNISGDWSGDKEWDYNFKIGYKETGWDWRPYVEFGNVQCTSDECDSSRQLRSRIGITYSF